MESVLVIGAVGQIGTELTMALRKKYGNDNVVAATRASDFPKEMADSGPCEKWNVTDKAATIKSIREHGIGTIYQLATLLSAKGEAHPDMAFDTNLIGLKTTLDSALECGVKKVFWPSSMAVFGPTTPRKNTPQQTVLEPTTMYGVTKVAGELLCQYCINKYGMDIRSLRYPGIISWKADPGGGTTDYAVEIFYGAIRAKRYTCFLGPKTVLPMMYMDDAIRGTLQVMDAPLEKLTVKTSYNFAAMSFSAEELAAEVGALVPGFECEYAPDSRQQIADSWPQSIDDSQARRDWGWSHRFGLREMSDDMLKNLKAKLRA